MSAAVLRRTVLENRWVLHVNYNIKPAVFHTFCSVSFFPWSPFIILVMIFLTWFSFAWPFATLSLTLRIKQAGFVALLIRIYVNNLFAILWWFRNDPFLHLSYHKWSEWCQEKVLHRKCSISGLTFNAIYLFVLDLWWGLKSFFFKYLVFNLNITHIAYIE